jgi:hypothetical protein
MKKMKTVTVTLVVALLSTLGLHASQETGDGQVQLPLEVYTNLVQQATDPTRPPRPAPAGYVLGNAGVSVMVRDFEERASSVIQVQLGIDVLEDEWVLIPVLPAGTPVESAQVDGKAVQLLATPDGLAWSTNKSGSYAMTLSYRVDASRSESGFTLPIPLPRAAAINVAATLPGSGLDVSVIPAAGTKTRVSGNQTHVTATVPTSSGVQISWRTPVLRGHTISRAAYAGALAGEAIVWTGRLAVELFSEETVTLPLFPRAITLSDVRVDGEAGTILVEDDRFATLVRGQGMHEVVVVFQTPVARSSGPPRVDFRIPGIPVSRFELTLPGKKELAVTPASNVTSTIGKESTTSVVHVPMTDRVAFSWSEAVPEDIRAELRSNAAIYHTVYAEEGVLYVHALVAFDVTRGETNVVDLLLPPGVQINRVESASGVVADWRLSKPHEDGLRTVSVFLDRQLQGELVFDVYYDRSLRIDEQSPAIDVPLIRSVAAQRQKGMVALLSSSELTLNPLETRDATKVGENQLPAFVREAVEMTIAHTYKYTESIPRLSVEAAEPERVQGKFDAQVDTLISLGDVTLTGSASIQVNIKSGRIMDFRLELPEGVSLLNLTAPSLRTYKVHDEDGKQLVDIEFTQEMEGQFRLDLTYERILADADAQVEVPTLAVTGAEVEQGRIAVEALSAVEVQPAATEQLSSLDINELPQQLILRTTNPILLAYKYVHADSPHRLALEVTRHAVLGVQEAAIDHAAYKTLFTSDGLLVTTAEFTVRNSRKQFLRIRLPERSEVWSTFVDGRPEKPALAEGDGNGTRDVLIKIINSTRAFDVRLIYATNGDKIGRLGTIEGALPTPDILVTQSRWDVFLPEEMSYGSPSTNMELAQDRSLVSRKEIQGELAGLEEAAVVQQAIRPLRISVPTAGVHYAFEKLYANQAGQDAWFRLPYASAGGAVLGQSISLAGTLLFWLGAGLFLVHAERARRLAALALATLGLAVLIGAVVVYHVSPTPALLVSVLVLVGAGAYYGRRWMPQWKVA